MTTEFPDTDQRRAVCQRQSEANLLEIPIYDVIGMKFGYTAAMLRETIAGRSEPLLVRINSPGGDVWEGKAIFELLKAYSSPVNVRIDSVAGSISSLIMLAGENIEIAEGGFVMVHGPEAMTMGNAARHQTRANLLTEVGEYLVDAYSARATVDRKTIESWVASTETWFSAETALDYGLVDRIDEQPAAAAVIDPARFNNIPSQMVVNSTYVDMIARRQHKVDEMARATSMRLFNESRRQMIHDGMAETIGATRSPTLQWMVDALKRVNNLDKGDG